MLLDSKLPEMDGLMMEQRFQSGRQTPPVVFLSSADSADDLRRGYEYGALSHIFKAQAWTGSPRCSIPPSNAWSSRRPRLTDSLPVGLLGPILFAHSQEWLFVFRGNRRN